MSLKRIITLMSDGNCACDTKTWTVCMLHYIMFHD